MSVSMCVWLQEFSNRFGWRMRPWSNQNYGCTTLCSARLFCSVIAQFIDTYDLFKHVAKKHNNHDNDIEGIMKPSKYLPEVSHEFKIIC